MLGLNLPMLGEWKSCDGDNTKLLNYPLDENSKVLEIGGYDGTWIKKISSKYNPFIFAIEPIPEFFHKIQKDFSGNTKFKILNVGVSEKSGEGTIFLNHDSSSMHVGTDLPIKVKFKTIEEILNDFGLESLDLVQINIEGEEYSFLERALKNGTINRFNNLQVQFHLGIDHCETRRENIQKGLLENGFSKNFDFPFIWEGWTKINP